MDRKIVSHFCTNRMHHYGCKSAADIPAEALHTSKAWITREYRGYIVCATSSYYVVRPEAGQSILFAPIATEIPGWDADYFDLAIAINNAGRIGAFCERILPSTFERYFETVAKPGVDAILAIASAIK